MKTIHIIRYDQRVKEIKGDFMKPMLTKSSWTNGPPTWITAFSVLELSRRGHHLAGLANLGYCEDFKKRLIYLNLHVILVVSSWHGFLALRGFSKSNLRLLMKSSSNAN